MTNKWVLRCFGSRWHWHVGFLSLSCLFSLWFLAAPRVPAVEFGRIDSSGALVNGMLLLEHCLRLSRCCQRTRSHFVVFPLFCVGFGGGRFGHLDQQGFRGDNFLDVLWRTLLALDVGRLVLPEFHPYGFGRDVWYVNFRSSCRLQPENVFLNYVKDLFVHPSIGLCLSRKPCRRRLLGDEQQPIVLLHIC